MKPSHTALCGACIAALMSVTVVPAFAGNVTGIAKLPGTLKKAAPSSGPATPPLHLECNDFPPGQLPTVIIATTIPGGLVITNNTAQGIAANTHYTYVVNGHSYSYVDHDSLDPGGHLVIAQPPAPGVSVQTACDATVPG